MSFENVPRCQHVKVNGTQCGSPALRRRRHCFFHHRMLDGRKRFAAECQMKPRPLFSICLLEDANAVQITIMQVLSLLGSGQMDHPTATLMLRGLRTASLNLQYTDFEVRTPTDVVIDRSTVAQTNIKGQQWFEEDFEASEEDEAEEEDQEEQDDEEQDDEEQEDADQPLETIRKMNRPPKPPVETDPNVALVAKHLQAEADRLDAQEEARQALAAARKQVQATISGYVIDAVRSRSAPIPG